MCCLTHAGTENRRRRISVRKNRKLFVIIITNNYYPIQGGITTYVDNLKKGLSTYTISNKVLLGSIYKYKNAGVRYFLILCLYLRAITLIVVLKVKGYRIIIHSHSANYCLLLSFIVTKFFRVRSIHTFHSPLNKADWILRRLTNKLDAVAYVSNMTRQLYRKLGVPINNEEHILPGGIDVKPYLKYNKKYNDKAKTLLFVGRIAEEKGILESIKALKNTSVDYTEYRIVGKPQNYVQKEYQKKIFEYITQNNLKDKVKFIGSKYRDELILEYINADLFLLPSIWEEPAPMVIAEAFSAACPIIGFNTGGLKERILNKTNGILVQKQNIKEFSKAIEFLFEKKERYLEYSKNARQYAITNLNNDVMITKHLKAYGIK